MRKRIAWLLGPALLLGATSCHFHRTHVNHSHGMPPGQAKKVLPHGAVKPEVKVRPATPWK